MLLELTQSALAENGLRRVGVEVVRMLDHRVLELLIGEMAAVPGLAASVIANVPQTGNPDLSQQILSTNVGTQVGGLDTKNKKVQDDGCN